MSSILHEGVDVYALKRLILVFAVVLLAALVVFFVLENRQVVSLVVLGWSTPALPLAVLVLVSLVIGLLVGPLLGLGVLSRSRERGRRAVEKVRD